MKRTRQPDQLPVEPDIPAPETAIDEAEIEIFEPEPFDRIRPTGRGFRSRLTASLAPAIAGVFLVCAMAFGATLGSTGSSGIDSDDVSAGKTVDATSADGKVAGDAPVSDRSEDGKGAPVDSEPSADEPKPADGEAPDAEKPGTEPAPAPEIRAIDLDVALGDGGRVRLEWGACAVDGFAAWKIVRSTDAGASFPLGGRDTLVAAFEAQGKSAFTDAGAPKGKKLWYAVFGLAGDGEARHVACRSRSRAIVTPAPAPAPKPTEKPAATTSPALGLTLAVKEGVIYIDFSECKAAGAEYYKVVRSSDSTVKWPAGESDTLVAAVGMDGKTAAWDKGAPSGKKAWYRVFCVRHAEDGLQGPRLERGQGHHCPREGSCARTEGDVDRGQHRWRQRRRPLGSMWRRAVQPLPDPSQDRRRDNGRRRDRECRCHHLGRRDSRGRRHLQVPRPVEGRDRGVVRPPRFDRLGSRDGRVEPRRTDDGSMDASRGPAADGTAGQWPGRPSVRTI